jgi:hypothetical protein
MSYSENTKIVPLPQFDVIYCNLLCFSVAITDLSENTAIKLSFLYLFYSTDYSIYSSTAILQYSFIILWMIPNIQNGLKEWKQ